MTEEKAKEIVRRIQSDLCGRGGLGFDGVDDETLNEITETWVSLVMEISSSENDGI